MTVVVALGGNVVLRPGQRESAAKRHPKLRDAVYGATVPAEALAGGAGTRTTV